MDPLLKVVALSALAATANAQAFNWTLEAPTALPGNRERTATGTDGALYYMYGGQNGSSVAGLDELWSYDGTTWSTLSATGASAGTRAESSSAAPRRSLRPTLQPRTRCRAKGAAWTSCPP